MRWQYPTRYQTIFNSGARSYMACSFGYTLHRMPYVVHYIGHPVKQAIDGSIREFCVCKLLLPAAVWDRYGVTVRRLKIRRARRKKKVGTKLAKYAATVRWIPSVVILRYIPQNLTR